MRRARNPSFKGFSASSPSSSATKRANTPKGTRPEVRLGKALKALGLKFKSHDESLPGSPDFVFTQHRVALFCDGDFWHGRNWVTLQRRLLRRANADYWIPKIASNRRRDRRVSAQLKRLGWTVMRVWESQVNEDESEVALRKVLTAIGKRPTAVKRVSAGKQIRTDITRQLLPKVKRVDLIRHAPEGA